MKKYDFFKQLSLPRFMDSTDSDSDNLHVIGGLSLPVVDKWTITITAS
jgi:hypothetical protein